jgi:hypothetical protein
MNAQQYSNAVTRLQQQYLKDGENTTCYRLSLVISQPNRATGLFSIRGGSVIVQPFKPAFIPMHTFVGIRSMVTDALVEERADMLTGVWFHHIEDDAISLYYLIGDIEK